MNDIILFIKTFRVLEPLRGFMGPMNQYLIETIFTFIKQLMLLYKLINNKLKISNSMSRLSGFFIKSE